MTLKSVLGLAALSIALAGCASVSREELNSVKATADRAQATADQALARANSADAKASAAQSQVNQLSDQMNRMGQKGMMK